MRFLGEKLFFTFIRHLNIYIFDEIRNMSKILKTRFFAFKKMAYTPKTAYYNTLHANISTTLPYSTIKIPHCNTLHLTVNTIFVYK